MTHATQRVFTLPVQCEETDDKISVECQDDRFGFDGLVVYEEESFPIRRCMPFQTGSNHGVTVPGGPRQNPTAAGQVQDSSAVNGHSATAGFTTNTDGADGLMFTDGPSPGFMAPVDLRASGYELMEEHERFEKETHVFTKGRKKKANNWGRMS